MLIEGCKARDYQPHERKNDRQHFVAERPFVLGSLALFGNNIHNQDYLLNQVQAASFLKLSKRTLERYRCYGGGPLFCKLGRRTMYRQADLLDWVNARVFNNTAEFQLAQQSGGAK